MHGPSRRLLAIGAHPDDCDYRVAGTAALFRRRGDDVRFVSVTRGDAGHHEISGDELAARRKREAEAAGQHLDVEYHVWDFPDGRLQPTLEVREAIIREIRSYRPDVVLTHRPNDYHPDHRYTSQAVCDAAYMVTVPAIAADVAAVKVDPVIGYFADDFTRPYPFAPDVVIDVSPLVDLIVETLACHESQVFEWLPYNFGGEFRGQVAPTEPDERIAWLRDLYCTRIGPMTDRYQAEIRSRYGANADAVRFIEAFEISEYGTQPTSAELAELFSA